MLSPTTFHDIVSGRRQGILATVIRCVLRVLEVPYGLAMRIRNSRYDSGQAAICQVGVPVVSVGNLSLGGTGKTPLVEWIARFYRDSELRVALVSRGYGAEEGNMNDEAMELALALPEVPHKQNRDRVSAAQAVIAEHSSQLIVLDDGFQHRRLARDLDIVLLDATEPFGFDHVFPRGTLREPLSGLQRADVVMLSRADMVDTASRKQIRQQAEQLAPNSLWCEVTHAPSSLMNVAGETISLESLAGKRIGAFCGIGNPQGFRHTLAELGCEIAYWREYPDHHRFSQEDVESITSQANDVDLLICTRKDLVKIRDFCPPKVWALGIELKFLKGENDLRNRLAKVHSECSK